MARKRAQENEPGDKFSQTYLSKCHYFKMFCFFLVIKVKKTSNKFLLKDYSAMLDSFCT